MIAAHGGSSLASPRARSLRSAALKAWNQWQEAAGPWQRFAVCLPLLGPGLDEMSLSDLSGTPPSSRDAREAEELALQIISRLEKATLIVLDLAPEIGVRVAAHLCREGGVRPLLVQKRWPYPHAILPVNALLRALLAESATLGSPSGSSAALVLDAEAGMSLSRSLRDTRVDNRFDLSAEDIPDAAALRAAGIATVLDVRRYSQPVPLWLADGPYASYAQAGLRIEQLDAHTG